MLPNVNRDREWPPIIVSPTHGDSYAWRVYGVQGSGTESSSLPGSDGNPIKPKYHSMKLIEILLPGIRGIGKRRRGVCKISRVKERGSHTVEAQCGRNLYLFEHRNHLEA